MSSPVRIFSYFAIITFLITVVVNLAYAQLPPSNRLTTQVTPKSVVLDSIDELIEFHIVVTNNSSVQHTDVKFNYIFKSSELEIVSGCSEEIQGKLDPGDNLSSNCALKVKSGIPENIGEVSITIGTLSAVGKSGLASSSIIPIKLPKTDANSISSNMIGCFDKESYLKLTPKYQNIANVPTDEHDTSSLRYIFDRYSIAAAGFILGIYLIPKKRLKRKYKKSDLVIPCFVIAASVSLLGYRLWQDKCEFFPGLKICKLEQERGQQEQVAFTELLRGKGGIQVKQEILNNGNVLLSDGYGRWQIEYPPYFTNQFTPETKTVVISGPSANANPDSGILTVQAQIDVFEKELLSDYDAFRKVVYKRLADQGVRILSESDTAFNIYDAKLVTVTDSSFSNSKITADGKIYFFETPRSFVIFTVYTNGSCREVFGDEVQKMIRSFLLLDEGVNDEV